MNEQEDFKAVLSLLVVLFIGLLIMIPLCINKYNNSENFYLIDTKTNRIMAEAPSLNKCEWRKTAIIRKNIYYSANQSQLKCRDMR